MVNTILEEVDLFCPNSVRINFTIYHIKKVKKNFYLIPFNKGTLSHL
ncbi:ABC transporter ATP-binding protein [Lactobacillus amylovorus]|nr:ABC transporter ATP-binding protein [Lactobacillus amylovorus]